MGLIATLTYNLGMWTRLKTDYFDSQVPQNDKIRDTVLARYLFCWVIYAVGL